MKIINGTALNSEDLHGLITRCAACSIGVPSNLPLPEVVLVEYRNLRGFVPPGGGEGYKYGKRLMHLRVVRPRHYFELALEKLAVAGAKEFTLPKLAREGLIQDICTGLGAYWIWTYVSGDSAIESLQIRCASRTPSGAQKAARAYRRRYLPKAMYQQKIVDLKKSAKRTRATIRRLTQSKRRWERFLDQTIQKLEELRKNPVRVGKSK